MTYVELFAVVDARFTVAGRRHLEEMLSRWGVAIEPVDKNKHTSLEQPTPILAKGTATKPNSTWAKFLATHSPLSPTNHCSTSAKALRQPILPPPYNQPTTTGSLPAPRRAPRPQ